MKTVENRALIPLTRQETSDIPNVLTPKEMTTCTGERLTFVGTIALPTPDYAQFIAKHNNDTRPGYEHDYLASRSLETRFKAMPASVLNATWGVYQAGKDAVYLIADCQLSVDQLHSLTTVVAPVNTGQPLDVLADWEEMISPNTEEGKRLYNLHTMIAGAEVWNTLLQNLECLLPMYQNSQSSLQSRYSFGSNKNEQFRQDAKRFLSQVKLISSLAAKSSYEQSLYSFIHGESVHAALDNLIASLAVFPFRILPCTALYDLQPIKGDQQALSIEEAVDRLNIGHWKEDGYFISDQLGSCFYFNQAEYHWHPLVLHEAVPVIPLKMSATGQWQLDISMPSLASQPNMDIQADQRTAFFVKVRQELTRYWQLNPRREFSSVAGLCSLYALDPEMLLPILPVQEMKVATQDGSVSRSQYIGQAQVPLLLAMRNMSIRTRTGETKQPHNTIMQGQTGQSIQAKLGELLNTQ